MIDLKFSYNWNHKLDCHAFTTIRLYNSSKHFKGQIVNLWLNDDPFGAGIIQESIVFKLADLNPFTSYLDTGYSVEETVNILKRMYPGKDWNLTRLVLLLIIKDKKKPVKQKKLFEQSEIK